MSTCEQQQKVGRADGGDLQGSAVPKGDALLLPGFLCFLLLLGLGVALVYAAGATGGMSRYLYGASDRPATAVIVALVLCAVAAAKAPPMPLAAKVSRLRPWQLALAALVIASAGVAFVYQSYAFSMDEFMTRLQAQVFAEGRLTGQVPVEWQWLGRALFHSFADYDEATGQVASNYRPGMAFLYTIFDLFGLGDLVSAFMLAGSVLLAASLARRIWPDTPEAPIVAALLVATSQQAMAMALTSYAMPAHLFLNLLWLRLFVADTRLGHVLAALVGVFTASLHQVHVHAFFAAPFFLMLVRPWRPWLLLFYGLVYLAGHAAVAGWDHWAFGSVSADAGADFADRVDGLARLPDGQALATVTALVARFFAWQNLALLPLLFIAFRVGRMPRLLILSAVSILLSLAPYPLLMPDQGHGWGYRYLHGLIANFALLGTAGWVALRQLPQVEQRRWRQAVLVSSMLTLLVMFPLRGYQIHRVVAPFHAASDLIASADADVVVVETNGVFYGWDLIRNDPFLRNRPVQVALSSLTPDDLRRLCRSYRVAFVSAAQLQSHDMVVMSGDAGAASESAMSAMIVSANCSPSGN